MIRSVPLAAAAVLLSGCAGMHGMHGAGHPHHGGPMAAALLQSTTGNTASGRVMFHAVDGGVYVHAMVNGLRPGQAHGFHIHEKGDCSSGDGMSTGGHFNPTGKPHGPQDGDRHAGDLPALQADAAGRVDVKMRVAGLTIGSGSTDIIGRGLIVHADPDDYKTQPTGNSGARIACGVITARR